MSKKSSVSDPAGSSAPSLGGKAKTRCESKLMARTSKICAKGKATLLFTERGNKEGLEG